MATLYSLTEVPLGQRVRIHQLGTAPDLCCRLREMGFFENAVVRCLHKAHGNIICEVYNARIGINNAIADSIAVSPYE
ncbi:MAG: ferrous iron transport protein A [Ignavibacteria bacterium]|nr:ferrous iron transport protein A [Ignavibacteria bacterium]